MYYHCSYDYFTSTVEMYHLQTRMLFVRAGPVVSFDKIKLSPLVNLHIDKLVYRQVLILTQKILSSELQEYH